MKLQDGLLPLLLSVSSTGAHAAAGIEDLERIRSNARDFVQSVAADATEISVGRLDPRLRLARCEAPFETFSANSATAPSIVGVRCPGASGWTLYVPVSITRVGPVAVLTRSLPRGATLTEADFRVEQRRLEPAGAQSFGAAQLPIGYELRQPLTAGTAIGPQHVRPLMVVRRGAQVQIMAVTAGVTVRMQGEALADAAAGARVKARNLASKRVVEGIARPDGSIEVTL